MNVQYLNVEIYNDTNNKKPCVYNNTYNDIVLYNPDDYQLSVIRFCLPSNTLPLFEFKENTYFITLDYLNVGFSQVVQYSGNTQENGYKFVYYVQDFITQINQAFLNSFNALKVAYPAAPPTQPPYITYDAITQLFTLWCQQLYLGNVKIFMNDYLYQFFNTFNSIHYGINNPNYKDYEIIITDNKNNISGSYYFFTQEAKSLAYWFDLRNIVFFVNGLKITGEETPSSKATNNNLVSVNNVSNLNNSSDISTVPILTDFQPYFNYDIRADYLQYQPNIYRYYDILTTEPIRNLNLIVKWENKKGEFYNIYLSPGQIISIKIMFKKKFLI